MTSGYIGQAFANEGGEVNLHGGAVGRSFTIDGGTVNLFGGSISDFGRVRGGTLNMWGGYVGSNFKAERGRVNLYGTEFILDGVDITGTLTPHSPTTISDRDVTLSGRLHNGSWFSFDLEDNDIGGYDHFSQSTWLTVTLTADPSVLGDLDGDGFVGITDLNLILPAWNTNVTPGDPLAGDPSGDGFVGIEDLNIVLGNWNAGSPPADVVIPEPTPAGLILLGVMVGALKRVRGCAIQA